MIIQQMRLQRGWSQQQLADVAGLNVRTIQRIENGQSASLETFKALGAAFDVDFSELQEKAVRQIVSTPEQTEIALAYSHVREVRRFWSEFISYALVITMLAVLNTMSSPQFPWVLFPALGWGIGLLIRGLRTFELLPWFGPEWEREQVEKRLGRKL